MTELTNYEQRDCMLPPLEEHRQAHAFISAAVAAHERSNAALCRSLLIAADIPELGAWVERLWGKTDLSLHQYRSVDGSPPHLPKEDRSPKRMPNAAEKREIVSRDGERCSFCKTQGFLPEVRKALHKAYPREARWGQTNAECHHGFTALWLTFDHVLPHSRGGGSGPDNVVLACQACNCARGERTLAEAGLNDPRLPR